MINIGDISKPSVDPGFDKTSKANKSASQTRAAEAPAPVKRVEEEEAQQTAGDRLTLSKKAGKKAKYPKKSRDEAGKHDNAQPQETHVKPDQTESNTPSDHIDLSV